MAGAPTRRQFLDLAACAVAAGIAATLDSCQDTLRSTFGRTPGVVAAPTSGPRKLTSLSTLTTTPMAIPFDTADGGDRVFAYTDGTTPVVLSSVCTHRGCTVAWDAASSSFACPCHGGVFDKQGKVVTGPPIAPLVSYPIQITAGDVYLQG